MDTITDKMQQLIDELGHMTKEELGEYLESCYQANKEAIDTVVAHDTKEYEMPEGWHIVGFESLEKIENATGGQ